MQNRKNWDVKKPIIGQGSSVQRPPTVELPEPVSSISQLDPQTLSRHSFLLISTGNPPPPTFLNLLLSKIHESTQPADVLALAHAAACLAITSGDHQTALDIVYASLPRLPHSDPGASLLLAHALLHTAHDYTGAARILSNLAHRFPVMQSPTQSASLGHVFPSVIRLVWAQVETARGDDPAALRLIAAALGLAPDPPLWGSLAPALPPESSISPCPFLPHTHDLQKHNDLEAHRPPIHTPTDTADSPRLHLPTGLTLDPNQWTHSTDTPATSSHIAKFPLALRLPLCHTMIQVLATDPHYTRPAFRLANSLLTALCGATGETSRFVPRIHEAVPSLHALAGPIPSLDMDQGTGHASPDHEPVFILDRRWLALPHDRQSQEHWRQCVRHTQGDTTNQNAFTSAMERLGPPAPDVVLLPTAYALAVEPPPEAAALYWAVRHTHALLAMSLARGAANAAGIALASLDPPPVDRRPRSTELPSAYVPLRVKVPDDSIPQPDETERYLAALCAVSPPKVRIAAAYVPFLLCASRDDAIDTAEVRPPIPAHSRISSPSEWTPPQGSTSRPQRLLV